MRTLATLSLAAAMTAATAACSDPVAHPTEPAGAGGATLHRGAAEHVPAPAPVRDLAALRWNALTRDLVIKYRTDPSARPYALVSLAQYAAAARAHEHQVRGKHADPHVAVAAASAAVLTYLYPAEAGVLAQLLRDEQAEAARDGRDDGRPDVRAARGEEIGRTAGEAVIAIARADGVDAPFTGTIPVGPGRWIPNGKPTTPMLGQMRPLLLRSGSQFRPPPPPAFGSAEYLAELAEVRSLAEMRTAEQADLARKWALSGGTFRTQGQWNLFAAELLAGRHVRSEWKAAHVLALLNAAMNDASIACFDAKYTYFMIRPSQADSRVTLVIGLPNHPSYPSSHSCTSGAGAAVLGALFRDDAARLQATAEEIGLSRLYAGIHYRFDIETGLQLGRRVAALAMTRDRREGLLGATGL